VADFPDLSVEIDGKKIDGMVRTFGDSEYGVGKLIALWDSNWRLMVSENDGYGRKVLKVKPGDKVRVRPYTK
jgi:S-adenosylmethionine hydrolase